MLSMDNNPTFKNSKKKIVFNEENLKSTSPVADLHYKFRIQVQLIETIGKICDCAVSQYIFGGNVLDNQQLCSGPSLT